MLIFDTGSEENSASPIMTAPATVAASFNSEALEANSNETAIHYSRPATIFAAVAASIFTFVGITGKNFDSHWVRRTALALVCFIAVMAFSHSNIW